MASSTAIITQQLAQRASFPIANIAPRKTNTLGDDFAQQMSARIQSGASTTLSPQQRAALREEEDILTRQLQRQAAGKNHAARELVKGAVNMINLLKHEQQYSGTERQRSVVPATVTAIQKAVDALADAGEYPFNASSDLAKNKSTLAAFTNALNTTPQPQQPSQNQQDQQNQYQNQTTPTARR